MLKNELDSELLRKADLKLSAMSKRIKRILLRESGAVSFKFDIYALKGENGHFSAKTSLQLKTIKLFIDPSFVIELDEKTIFKILIDLGRHEIGHWEYPRGSKCGCPFDIFHAIEIYDAVDSVLAPIHLKNFTDFVANSFMDIVVNTNVEFTLRKYKDHFKGIVLFYYDQGAYHGTYSDFYSFFVRIQELLWMTKEDRLLLEKFHPKKREIEDAVNDFISQAQLDGDLNSVTNQLNTKEKWIALSILFAKYAVPFLKRYKILEILVGGERPDNESEIMKWLHDPNNIAKVIVRRINKGDNRKFSFIEDTTALWLYYTHMAKNIVLQSLNYGKAEYLNAVKFGKKQTVLFSRKLGITQAGDIEFVVPKFVWKIPIVMHKDIKEGIPNLYFILDVSGSMESGDTTILNSKIYLHSRYHYALLGVFGVLKYLQAKSLLPKKIALTVFSDTSKSEIATPENLKSLGTLLFNPSYGGTYLNVEEVKKVLDKLGKSVIILLSDGEIDNWRNISGFMIDIMHKNFSAFISIRSKTEAFYDLKDVCEVVYVTDERDLANIMINLATRKYTYKR